MAQGKIFVCYRREDSAGHAGRLYDRLNQRFPGRVFMDVASIGIGTRWNEVIDTTLSSCEVAVVLIGKRWLDAQPGGTRRIDEEADPTRAEIRAALRLKLRVVPLLVSGAAMPNREDLPQDIAELCAWQALRVDDDDFDHDTARLVTALEQQLVEPGLDPHVESVGARDQEIGRLMDSAEQAVTRRDWLGASQTLRSVLSLDRQHAHAASRLAWVEQRAREGTAPVVEEPTPRRTGWFSLGIGSLRLWVSFGIAMVALVVVTATLSERGNMSPDDMPFPDAAAPGEVVDGDPAPDAPAPDAPPPDGPAPSPAAPARPARPGIAAGGGGDARNLAGMYDLAGYRLQGVEYPISGELGLAPLDGGRGYEFTMAVTDFSQGGVVLRYVGFLQPDAGNWTTLVIRTSDPEAVVNTPIPTRVTIDNRRLVIENALGQYSVWTRR